ncbi:hypothetical protein K501DRAFT_269426 [Backusella circina FSU 941]|nr:hypothetical protein K501DRAFT_269426 [Backusella circina FSU 941]
MPKSNSQVKQPTKSKSKTNVKPYPGKRIANINTNKENIPVPVSGWNSLTKIVESINDGNILINNPIEALNTYSRKLVFSNSFENLYVAKQAREQDRLGKDKCHELAAEATDPAGKITSMALDVVKDSAMNELVEASGSGSKNSNDMPIIKYHSPCLDSSLEFDINKNYIFYSITAKEKHKNVTSLQHQDFMQAEDESSVFAYLTAVKIEYEEIVYQVLVPSKSLSLTDTIVWHIFAVLANLFS